MRTSAYSLFFSVLCSHALAGETLLDARSPDYAYDILLLQKDPTQPQLYELALRSTASNKIIFSSPIGGYASFSRASDPFNLKCLWSPDSKFLAVGERGAKHGGDLHVYRLLGDRAEEVSLPDVADAIRPQLKANFRSYFVRPEVWLPAHELLVSVTGTQEREENGDYRFIACFHLSTSGAAATLKSLSRDHTIDQ